MLEPLESFSSVLGAGKARGTLSRVKEELVQSLERVVEDFSKRMRDTESAKVQSNECAKL